MSGSLIGTKDTVQNIYYTLFCSQATKRQGPKPHCLPKLYRLFQQIFVEQLSCTESCVLSSEDEKERDWRETQPQTVKTSETWNVWE